MQSGTQIAVVGDFNETRASHQAIRKALSAAAPDAQCVWIATDEAGITGRLAGFHGIWCAPGIPYRSAEGATHAIRHARLTRTPFLGTSAGFQYALLEYARDALGLSLAEHQKTAPEAAMPLISPLGCALMGVRAKVNLLSGSKLRQAYGATEAVEEYHCSYGLNNRYRRLIERGDLCVAATDEKHEIRAVELDGHPFFVATLFQPELRSLEDGAPASPIVMAFAAACRERAARGTTTAAR